jgi:DNA-binding MurR/RpiR family transcriptional regulator
MEELSRVYPRLTKPQKRVADFILRQPGKAREASVSAICRATRTSEPVLFAVCRAAGRRGYRELKLDLAGELAVRRERRRAAGRTGDAEAPDVELNGNESPASLARKIGVAYLESVEAVVSGLDAEAFTRAAQMLIRARRASVFGMGVSGHVARLAEYALLRAGLAVTCSTDFYVQLSHLAALGEGDVALAISYMGGQPELAEGLELARRRGAATIALTSDPESPLAAVADQVVRLPSRPPLASYVSLGARIAAAELYVVDALAAAVALAGREEFDERAAAVREVVEERKTPAARRRRGKKRKKESGS